MLTRKRQPGPGRYGYGCGSGQLSTDQVQPEEAPAAAASTGRYGYGCGSGQLATDEVQPEEQRGLHLEDDRAQSVPKRPERVVWTNVQ
jgi:hypothetical protein